MFEALSRGWTLTKTSLKVLRLDKEMLLLPLMAAVLMLLAVVGLGAGAFGIGFFAGSSLVTYVALFGVFVLVYAIAIFFNAAVIEMATIRFNGGDPVIRDGLRKAWSRKKRILQWAVVAATVGIILRILRDQARDNFIARMLIGFLELGWNVATFFVVPIAVYQDVGPIDALKGSMGRMKQTWGESMTNIFTTGIVFGMLALLGLPVLFLAFLAASTTVMVAAIVLVVLYWVVLGAIHVAVDGIFVAALYKYTVEGRLPEAYQESGVRAESLAW